MHTQLHTHDNLASCLGGEHSEDSPVNYNISLFRFQSIPDYITYFGLVIFGGELYFYFRSS